MLSCLITLSGDCSNNKENGIMVDWWLSVEILFPLVYLGYNEQQRGPSEDIDHYKEWFTFIEINESISFSIDTHRCWSWKVPSLELKLQAHRSNRETLQEKD